MLLRELDGLSVFLAASLDDRSSGPPVTKVK